MSEKYLETAAVIRQDSLAEGIMSLYLQTEKIAQKAQPGQFVSVYSHDRSRLLPRPISICEADSGRGVLRLVYRIAGAGTEEFSRLGPGDTLDLTGPLGNGFPMERAEGKRVMLIGGGIGIPPLAALAGRLRTKNCAEITAVLGYRDAQLFLEEEISGCARTCIATEDGSIGTRGTVLDLIREHHLAADVIFACGPTPMLRALQEYARQNRTECWISLEERMACGIGACLACVCKTKEADGHTKVCNARICAEGPVFSAETVLL